VEYTLLRVLIGNCTYVVNISLQSPDVNQQNGEGSSEEELKRKKR
jgi:hypothetical protein